MEIITRKITEEEIEIYINLLMSKIENWEYFAGPCLSSNKEWFDEDAAPQIIDELKSIYEKNSNSSALKSILIQLGLLPDDIIIVMDNGISSALPIYTSIETINYEDSGSVLAKAFFGNETHLLNNYGNILYEESYHHLKLGLGNLLMIQINDDYDTQVKGRQPQNQFEIINYSAQYLNDRRIAFKTDPDTKYKVRSDWDRFNKEVIGNGNEMIFENLPLGEYSVIKYVSEFDESTPLGGKKFETILKISIGERYENSSDFTLNSEIFPYIDNYSDYKADLISKINAYPDKELVLLNLVGKYNGELMIEGEYITAIFPYLPEEFRTDLDVLLAVYLIAINNNFSSQSISKIFKQIPQTLNDLTSFINSEEVLYEINDFFPPVNPGNFFPIRIPIIDSDEVGDKKKSKIKSFISDNLSRIKEVLFLFPHILRYADQNILSDRDLVLLGLKYDTNLIKYIPENLLNDEGIVIAAAQDDFALKFASESLKTNRIFVEKMILINGNHINESGDFKTDREMIKSALVLSKKPVDRLDKDILKIFSSDREIMALYVNQNKYHIKDVSDDLLADKEYFSSLIGAGFDKGLHISHLYYSKSDKSIFKEYLKDKDMVKRMLSNYPGDIDKVEESFKTDKDILITIISQKGYGHYIKYGDNKIRNDKELIELAISDSSYNIKYAGEIILRDTDFLIEMIKKQPECFKHLPEEVQKAVEEKMTVLEIQDIIINKNNVQESNENIKGISDFLKHINDEDDLPF